MEVLNKQSQGVFIHLIERDRPCRCDEWLHANHQPGYPQDIPRARTNDKVIVPKSISVTLLPQVLAYGQSILLCVLGRIGCPERSS